MTPFHEGSNSPEQLEDAQANVVDSYCSVLIEQEAMGKTAKQSGAGPRMTVVEVLHALADPVRLEIVRQLKAEGEKSCGSFGIDMPKSSLSHHFRVLRETGVIASESQGTVIMNRLQQRELDARFPGLLESVLNATHNPRSRLARTGPHIR